MSASERWWGWETLLAFSLFGGTLQILPLPSGFAWGVTILGFVSSMLWVGVLIITRGIRLTYHARWFIAFFYLFLLWVFVSLSWSPINSERLVSADAYIILHMIAPTIVILVSRESPSILGKRWLAGALIAVTLIFLYVVYIWLTSGGGLYSVFQRSDQAIYLGTGTTLMSFAIVCFMWSIYGADYRKSVFILGVFALWMTIETGARGPILWGTVAVLIMAAFDIHRRSDSLEHWVRASSLFFIFLLVSYLLISHFIPKNDLMDRAVSLERMSSDRERGFDDLSSIGARIIRYKEAELLIYEKPIIGNGALSYRMMTRLKDEIYPHNIFLDVLGDLGIVGLILVVYLFFKAFYGAWYVAGDRQKIYSIMSATLFIYYFGMAQSSGYLYWSELWPWAAIVVIQIRPRSKTIGSLV